MLDQPVTSFGATLHEGAVYMYGGYFGVPHSYGREGQSGDLVRLELTQGTSKVVSTGPGVQGAQLVSTAQGLLRVGGMRALNASDEPEHIVSLDEVALFDPELGDWEVLTKLTEPRSSHAAVSLKGRLYVLGGWILGGDRKHGRFADHALIVDLESGAQESLVLPRAVRAAQAAVIDGKIALVGGLGPDGKPQRRVSVLDPATHAWSEGPELPSEAFGVAVASDGKRLFASARDGVVYALDDLAGSWHPVAYLAFPRFFHQLVMLDESHLVALGGISGMHFGSRVAHVEVLDLAQSGPRVLRWTLASPSPAKNRQGVALLNEHLVVFGGNRSLEQHDFGPDDFRREAFAIELATMRVSPLPPFPAARQTVQTLTLDGELLALGGFGHDGKKARAHADAFAFDAQAGAWEPYGSTLPAPRTQFGLASSRDALWILGGLDYDPSRSEDQQFVHPTTVLTAKPGEPFTVSTVTLPRARRAFGGALLDGKYYLVGGMADGFAPVDSCDVLDLETRGWSEIPCPAVRISAQLVALRGQLYLVGGSTFAGESLSPEPKLEAFDPASGGWRTVLESLPLSPRHLAAVAYGHALLLYSAQRDDGKLAIAMIVPPVAASTAEPGLGSPLRASR